MKIFVDANILVAVLNKEYPVFTYAARVLSLADTPEFQVYTSPLALAMAFYFSSKKSGEKVAKRKISLMNEQIRVAVVTQDAVSSALDNKRVNDLEDGFQYYAALESGCNYIITEDLNDFYFSEIEVMGSEKFLKSYF